MAPVSGAISRPALQNHSGYQEMNFVRLSHNKVTFDVDRDIRPQHYKSSLIDEVIVYGSLFVAHWYAVIGAFRSSLLFRLLDGVP